jgi:drug/metabolite transporter (DMT)-like permease
MVGICTGLALQAGASPLTVVTLRTLGTLALFYAYFRAAGVSLAMTRREWLLALAIGIPLSINNYLVNAAMAEIPVPLVVLIFYLWPALTTAASWVLGTDRFRWPRLAGLALAFAGVGLAVNVDFTAAQAKGVWFAAGAALTWSVTFMLTSHYFRGRDQRAPTLAMISAAATVFVFMMLVTRDFVLPQNAPGWAGVLGVPFFYAFAMIGLFTASARLGPMRAGFFMNFEPIASVGLAALILGQSLAPVQLAGGALVMAALFLFRPPPARDDAPRRSEGAAPSRRS